MSETDQPGPSDERPFSAVPKPDAAGAPAQETPARRSRFNLPEGAFGIFVLLLVAAVSGGLIAVYWPWLTGAGPDNSALADRVGALETHVGQIAAGQAPTVAAANFDELKRTLSALQTRLDADEARLSAIEKSSGTNGDVDVGALKAELDKNSSDITQLGQRLDALAAAQATKSGANPQLSEKLDANEKAIAGLRSDIDAQTHATGEALGKFDARIAALEKTAPPADLAQRLDSFATKSQTAALATRLSHLEDQDLAGLVRRAAAVMALADLVRASERDGPFVNELEALRTVMPSSPELTDLARYAGHGAPTVPTLAAQFQADIDPILSAERAAQAHNWAERFWADIVSLISVRRVGNIAGNDTQARVARAEFALKHGDLAAALRDVEGLDAPAKAAASTWLKQARARLAVNRDARALTSRVVAALAAARVTNDAKPKTDAQ